LGRWQAPQWLFEVSATTQFAELYGGAAGLGPIADARLPTVPKLRGQLRAEANLSGLSDGLKAGFTAQFHGPSHLSFDPQLDRATPAYGLIGLYADWSWHGLALSLAADNLFNSAADSFAFGNPFSIRKLEQRTPVRPRSISLSLEKSF
jgi:hypothetical protein